MKYSTNVQRKIKEYNPRGDLAHTAKFFLVMCQINHMSTKQHMERVALLADKVAIKLHKDKKATFFAGLLHDVGKLLLPANLFDGHDINSSEYEQVKTHALNSFNALKKFHLFTALVAGLHHNIYKAGYGITIKDFPKDLSPATIKKILDISSIISVCDFVDAYLNRKTQIKDGSDKGSNNLKDMLYNKYPDDADIINIVLKLIEKK
jgi:response regulator RpfG family c-di-GMP phosphodiesterase